MLLSNQAQSFKTHSTCVRALIGRHMASFATRTNPIATSSTLISDVLLCELLAPFALTCAWKHKYFSLIINTPLHKYNKKICKLLKISVNISACDWLEDKKRLISWVRWPKCFMVSSSDSGSFSPGPKIFGKKEGRRRPRAKLASVTVRGPPRKIPQGISIMFFYILMHVWKLLLCKMLH